MDTRCNARHRKKKSGQNRGRKGARPHHAQTEKSTYRTSDAINPFPLNGDHTHFSGSCIYQGKVSTQVCRTYLVYFRSNLRFYVTNTTCTGRLKVRCYECTPLMPPLGTTTDHGTIFRRSL